MKQLFLSLAKTLVFVLVMWSLTSSLPARAQMYGLQATGARLGYNTQDTVYSIVTKVISISFGLIAILFFALLVYGGLRWMTARGQEEYTTKAKEIITAAILGIIIMIAAYAITTFIFSRLGSVAGQFTPQNTASPSLTQGCCISMRNGTVNACEVSTEKKCYGEIYGSDWRLKQCSEVPDCPVVAKTDCNEAMTVAECINIDICKPLQFVELDSKPWICFDTKKGLVGDCWEAERTCVNDCTNKGKTQDAIDTCKDINCDPLALPSCFAAHTIAP